MHSLIIHLVHFFGSTTMVLSAKNLPLNYFSFNCYIAVIIGTLSNPINPGQTRDHVLLRGGGHFKL